MGLNSTKEPKPKPNLKEEKAIKLQLSNEPKKEEEESN